MNRFDPFDPKPFAEALPFGLQAQDAIFRHLSLAKDRRVWKADEVEGKPVYHDSEGLPIPDLISMEANKGITLVEVKAKRDWWQEHNTDGPLSTIIEAEHIVKYARVAERYCTRVAMVFVVRGLANGRWAPRGPAGCWWCYIEALVPFLTTEDPELIYSLPKRERGGVNARRLRRIQDGGPLRPFAPWDEASLSVPRDAATQKAWRAAEGIDH
jgi:hypothetical protein